MDKIGGIADEKLGKSHRSCHLDAGLGARAQDRYATGDEHRHKIDQDEDEQELNADRAPVP